MTKMHTVELDVEGAKREDVEYWVNEIANQYADLAIENVNLAGNKVAFKIGSPSMEDISADDIKFRLQEYMTMNEAPFRCKNLRVG